MHSNSIYYGVHVPNEPQIEEYDGSTNVYCEKIEALKEVKKYKKARFKAFQFYHEALEFALHGSEYPNNNSMTEMNPPLNKTEMFQTVGEKPSQFRGPKSQDLVKFRKAIELGAVKLVKSTVWENPRYLISSGDTPAILQEGSRYNALHVAAKAKNAEMVDVILTTVGSPDFIQMLYGEENRTNSEAGSKILLDLYLNTPDKGLNETPLHFAVKFGAADVVEILVSYPQCNKTVLNKFSHMPKDIICSRIKQTPALVARIASLLEDRFYVPVLRSEDNCVQPSIGEPFSAGSPPELNTNPINPRIEIHAYAGPMKREDASIFRKKWKTPPRTPGSPSVYSKPAGSPLFRTPERFGASVLFRLQDTEKGLERVGRDLAKQCQVGWKEYWPFLGTFTDLTSEEGLSQLEEHIKALQLTAFSESMSNSINKSKLSDDITINGSCHSSSSIVSPMTDLCKNFEAFTLSDNSLSKKEFKSLSVKPSNVYSTRDNESILEVLSKSGLSPFLCIEKSCQVFANRIANHIIFLAEHQIGYTADALESEVKHLKSLIGSYMDDIRFNSVNFQSVHSRIAHLAATKLKDILSYEDELDGRQFVLESIIKKYDKMIDFFSSDDEDLNCYRQPVKIMRRKSTSNSKQVICLVESILKSLQCEQDCEKTVIVTEDDCIKVWSTASACSCVWKTSNKSGRKGSLLKKGSSYKYSTKWANCRTENLNKYWDNVSRRLTFSDEDCVSESKGDTVQNSEMFNDELCIKNSINQIGYLLSESSASSEEEFISANNSPDMSDSDDDDELFEEPEQEDLDVYIEGSVPTKMDYAVYTAIQNLNLDPQEYPSIYRWKHAVKLHSEEERMSWPSPSTARYKIGMNSYAGVTSTPHAAVTMSSFTPPHSWLRITGQNSPIRSLNAIRGNSSLPYGENCYYS